MSFSYYEAAKGEVQDKISAFYEAEKVEES